MGKLRGREKFEDLTTSVCSMFAFSLRACVHVCIACVAHAARSSVCTTWCEATEQGSGATCEHAYRCVLFRYSGLPSSSRRARLPCDGALYTIFRACLIRCRYGTQ